MINKIGIIGAGMMGTEISLCFARKQYQVYLMDVNVEIATNSKAKQGILINKKKEQYLEDANAILERIHIVDSYEDFKEYDLVVEAVTEIFEVKKEVFERLDKICKSDAIIASNTSSISITKLASSLNEEKRKNFIGTHFNSPATVMKLVEVIPGLQTCDECIEKVIYLLDELDKEPIKVKDVVGFALNRIFHAMYLEACRLVEEGVCSVEDVDKICKFGLGHPMGIFKLLDITSHDLNLYIDEILFEAYGDRFRPSPQIKRLVDAGKLGRKAGSGFYDYNK